MLSHFEVSKAGKDFTTAYHFVVVSKSSWNLSAVVGVMVSWKRLHSSQLVFTLEGASYQSDQRNPTTAAAAIEP